MVEYKQFTDIEHVLKRTEMYLGDCKYIESNECVYDYINNICSYEKLKYSPGLLKIFDEAISNSFDNKTRDNNQHKMTYIKININGKEISIENDGYSIPIEIFENTNKYIPQVLFSELRSSSNYNNKRSTSGLNGLGIKLTNILSKKFNIKIVNNNIMYEQTIENNNSIIYKPNISKINNNNYVNISFIPDLDKIDEEFNKDNSLWDSTLKIIYKKIYEIKGLFGSTLNIFINNVELPDITFENFAINMKNGDFDFKYKYIKTQYFTLFISLSNSWQQISFVNNIKTKSGGGHVDYILNNITDAIIKRGKFTETNIKNTIKSKLYIVLSAYIQNPVFTSQSKEKLTKMKKIEKAFQLPTKFLDELYEELDFKNILTSKNIDNLNKIIKRSDIQKIEKLTDAECAGKKNHECTLFICEGDSALSLAKIGMTCDKIGKKIFGCYPLGGKIINTKKKSVDCITKNKILKELMLIIGLTLNTKYMDTKSLRYQHIVMLKDADADGAHIMTLVYNFLDTYFKDLLKIEGFFSEFITPMIKVPVSKTLENQIKFNFSGTIVHTKKEVIYPFYNEIEFKQFMKDNAKIKYGKPKYIKGLAGNQSFEIVEYFKEYIKNVINIIYDKHAEKTLIKAFSKGFEDNRKLWLQDLTDFTYLPRIPMKPINMTDFLNTDLLTYMYDDCYRSIPCSIDGLKPSQRKVLYTLFKKSNPYTFEKVVSLTGTVMSFSHYHHGNESLNGTIIKMTQNYPGSNNLPFLKDDGFFGSREQLGDDAGAPRYISVALSKIARYIFPIIDDELLEYRFEDDAKVEPLYYIPIIPTILINGANGVGTGWRSYIPMYSVIDIINIVERLINNENEINNINLIPYCNNWKGNIKIEMEKNQYKKINIYGTFKYYKEKNVINITEIPYNISFINYKKNTLNKLIDLGIIKSISDDNVGNKADLNTYNKFIKLNIKYNSNEDIYKNFDLIASEPLTVLNAFNDSYTITHYENINDIIEEWFYIRQDLYIKRKEYMTKIMENELNIISNKARFIKMIIEKELKIMKRKEIDIINDLIKLKFDKNNDSYNYLLNMQIYNMTYEKYQLLIKEFEKRTIELEEYKNTSYKQIWLNELNLLKNKLKSDDL